tara:strand:- start:1258 stop:2166 length:909 start_codon:yes stop_codon:yes gene_type:complete
MFKKKIRIGLIGFGRFGKKYFNNINKSKTLKLEFILKKRINIVIKNLDIYNSLSKIKNISSDGVIIASPPETHFKLSKFFLKSKKGIILEKPAVSNLNQLKKIIKMKKDNSPLLVNHSDLYNPLFQEIQKYKSKIGKIKFLNINYGKFDYQYKNHRGLLPAKDWLPHILAVLTFFLKKKLKFKITHKKLIKKKNCFFQELYLDVFYEKNKLIGKILFSNFKKNRSVEVIGNKGFLRYDAYNLNNNCVKINNKTKNFNKFCSKTPMENLLDIFSKSIKKDKKVNDLKVVLRYQKYLDKINNNM